MPRIITTGMRYTKLGIVCMMSSAGVSQRCSRSDRLIRMPSGRPSVSAVRVLATIIASVRMVSCHMPK